MSINTDFATDPTSWSFPTNSLTWTVPISREILAASIEPRLHYKLVRVTEGVAERLLAEIEVEGETLIFSDEALFQLEADLEDLLSAIRREDDPRAEEELRSAMEQAGSSRELLKDLHAAEAARGDWLEREWEKSIARVEKAALRVESFLFLMKDFVPSSHHAFVEDFFQDLFEDLDRSLHLPDATGTP